jgi:hypothetical protein
MNGTGKRGMETESIRGGRVYVGEQEEARKYSHTNDRKEVR